MNYIDNYEDKINDYINTFSLKYSNLPNITGVGLGRKTYDNYRTSVPTLTFFVDRKISASQIPTRYVLPQTIGSMITDVVETGEISCTEGVNENNYFDGNQIVYPNISLDKVRPAYGGLSCSNELAPVECEGTIGYAVTDAEKEEYIYILSCAHVLTRDFSGRSGDQIVQPAKVYRNYSPIGKLSKAIPLIPKSEKAIDPTEEMNYVNAAIAFVGKNESNTRKTLLKEGIGPDKILIDEIKEPKIGDEIWKIGPYPQLTKSIGKVESVNVTLFAVKIKDKIFQFKNQNFADISYYKGDSGAIMMRESKSALFKKIYAVGMCIGGAVPSNGKPYALFTTMNDVLSTLRVKLLK